METLEHVVTLNIHRDIITAVAFSCDGRLLYSCAQDSSIRVHSLEDQQQIHTNNVGDLGLSSIIVLPDNDVRGKLVGLREGMSYLDRCALLVKATLTTSAHADRPLSWVRGTATRTSIPSTTPPSCASGLVCCLSSTVNAVCRALLYRIPFSYQYCAFLLTFQPPLLRHVLEQRTMMPFLT
jgi:hypothetical protein